MDHIPSTIPCHESCNIHRGCSEYDLQNQYKPKLIIYKSNYLLCLPTRLKLEATILQAQDTIHLRLIFKQPPLGLCGRINELGLTKETICALKQKLQNSSWSGLPSLDVHSDQLSRQFNHPPGLGTSHHS